MGCGLDHYISYVKYSFSQKFSRPVNLVTRTITFRMLSTRHSVHGVLCTYRSDVPGTVYIGTVQNKKANL